MRQSVCKRRRMKDRADLRRRERLVAGLSGVDDLVEQAVEEPQHHDDEVVGRRLDERLAAVSDEVEARLDEPREQVAQHVAVLRQHGRWQLLAHARPSNGPRSGTTRVSRYQKAKTNLGPDLQNILRQSYDYLTIMPKLRSTYDRRLIYKTSYNE